jgi:cysteine protease ATG4
MENNPDANLIQKCINISCVEKNDVNNNTFSFGWTISLASFKDDLIYNYFRFNSKFDMPRGQIHIYNKIYDSYNPQDVQKFNEKLSKIIYVSYRSKYKPQVNIKNNKTYTSDCGWGCMIRSSQMILCRALYKIFKYIYKLDKKIINRVIPFVMDKNLDIIKNEYLGMDSYIDKLKEFGKKDIIEIDPPFSIHKIVILGEKFGRTSGEWFSDFELPKIYNIINTTFNVVPNLSIIHYNSFIELEIILERCFKEIVSNNIEDNDKIFNLEGKSFIMEKMGLIFVSVRLGLDNVSPEYFPSIKKLFSCKECLGFIGGKKWTNSASYFLGYYDDFLLYLDPHFNNQSIDNLDNNTITSYKNKTIYKIDIKTLKAGFTIGFLFRNMKEFNELVNFFMEQKKDENPCFSFTEKKVENEFEKDNINNNSDKDDF